jgi:hypothetical protein
VNSTHLIDAFRSEMSDLVAPYLWEDVEAYSYLDDAQTWFCRLTDGIADARTPAVTRLNIVPGTDWYDTSPLIRQIRKATRSDTGLPVKLYTAEQADSACVVFAADRLGANVALVRGLEANAVRTTPMPDSTHGVSLASSAETASATAVVLFADTTGVVAGMGVTASGVPVGTLVSSVVANTSVTLSANVTAVVPIATTFQFGTVVNLSVYRLPLIMINADGDQELEIDAQHHTALLHWMKHRAYDKQDAETFDRRKSDDFKARFEAYCNKAQQDAQRARRVQGNVVYGGL